MNKQHYDVIFCVFGCSTHKKYSYFQKLTFKNFGFDIENEFPHVTIAMTPETTPFQSNNMLKTEHLKKSLCYPTIVFYNKVFMFFYCFLSH